LLCCGLHLPPKHSSYLLAFRVGPVLERATTPTALMLRWRVAPSKHPPRTPALSPQPSPFEAPAAPPHLRMRVALLCPLRGTSFGNLMVVRVAACGLHHRQAFLLHGRIPRWSGIGEGNLTHRPHAEVLWPKGKASKHPPHTPALSPQPSSFEAPAGHLRMRVAALRPAPQRTQLAPAFRTQRPKRHQTHRYQKPRPPLKQASPFTRQHLPVA
jgi:hypothetical protein